MITVIDFGSQYTLLIAKKIRKIGVYCIIIQPSDSIPIKTKGVILSGSPDSIEDNFDFDFSKINCQVLGICYGAQLIAKEKGCEIISSKRSEYGQCSIDIIERDNLVFNLSTKLDVWMSHSDTIKNNDRISLIALTENNTPAIFQTNINKYSAYGVQFHPEVSHTTFGFQILSNFVELCGCDYIWEPKDIIHKQIIKIREKVDDNKVVMAVSGGVDSTIAGLLIQKAIGKDLHCIFVDNGLLRPQDKDVINSLSGLFDNLKIVDASETFLDALKNITDPEKKRKIIGKLFIETFQEEAKKIGGVKFLGQGTIYSDVIESKGIKSHHNVGGLPEKMDLELIEPLRNLFKDEVREVGSLLSIPQKILNRHPFPGPGLAIRIMGEVTKEKVEILQKTDQILYEFLIRKKLYVKIWQAGVILLSQKTVGVAGDKREYKYTIAIRAVTSEDGMTARCYSFPSDTLEILSTEITNKISEVNRVVYDITNKPPGTIEWE